MSNFTVNILGCSSATQSARHSQSAQVVDFRDKLFMIDCGEGTQGRFRKQGLKFSRLTHIFISHLHGDHFFGLPGLLSTMALHGIEGEVTVHAFAEGLDLLRGWMDFFNREPSFRIRYAPVTPGATETVYEDGGLTVTAFPLYHRIPCSGYIFREKPSARPLRGDMLEFHKVPVAMRRAIKEGADFIKPDGTVIPNSALTRPAPAPRSYAYCSDTMFDPRVAEAVKGVGTVYHEATYGDDLAAMARERGHSTAREAAVTAREAGASGLILGHYSKRYDAEGEQRLLSEARLVFPDTFLSDEGMVFKVGS
ncbi:MAG: ribonuclease Z [Duncaniella sp.]|nr:ribonuclease Z [Duncaniella sp.]MDE6178451.1 ribonuclease Z [Duncaniella sp.]